MPVKIISASFWIDVTSSSTNVTLLQEQVSGVSGKAIFSQKMTLEGRN